MGKIVIPVIWLNYLEDAPCRGYWDQGMVEDMLHNCLWNTGYDFDHREARTLENLDKDLKGAIVVFPARNQVQYADKLNDDLQRLDWVILILTGDEESAFPVEKVDAHPRINIWVMSPQKGRHDKYSKLGSGYPTHMHRILPDNAPTKDIDLFFSGQITHERRKKMRDVMEEMRANKSSTDLVIDYHFSEGFTQGIEPQEYFDKLSRAKVAPAPSGPESPDSFRLFEALEVGAIPIAENRVSKKVVDDDYWTWFFGEEPPFPVTSEWDWLQGWTQDQINIYPSKNNKIGIWWINKKREMALRLRDQIKKLSGSIPFEDLITVLMPSSVVPRHPSTDHIEQNIHDLREQLPTAPVFIMLDGIRPELESRRADYEEYQRRLIWLCNHKWTNVLPIRFEEFGHQSTMTRGVMDRVATPYILFVEHDTPVVPDFKVEWDKLCEAIYSGEANVIRLHHEANVHPEHESMMLTPPLDIAGAMLRKTSQWSQRPHLASTAFYRYILDKYFTDNSRAFIEHGVYGPCVEAFNTEGILGWNLWKLWLYTPSGDNIKRSYDLNSRESQENFESTF